MNKDSYVAVGIRPWNRTIFENRISEFPGDWHFYGSRESFDETEIKAIDPRYVFFLHWSWMVPPDLVTNYECVGFHSTNLPFGRGGSPIQNLIERGEYHTTLSVFRMVEELDAGPIYLQKALCLNGSAEEIYLRLTHKSADAIREIIENRPKPEPQTGEPTVFKRRQPEESRISEEVTLDGLYDLIRMLDAEEYPKAFLDHAGFRFTFSRAARYDQRVEADVKITKKETEPTDPGADSD